MNSHHVAWILAAAFITLGCSSSANNSSAVGGSGSGAAGAGGHSNNGGSVSIGGAKGPSTCSEAATPYTLTSTTLDASFVPHVVTNSWGAELMAQVPVAVGSGGDVYVGFTRNTASTNNAAIVRVGGPPADLVEIPNASMAGLAVTKDGFGALLFDPNDSVDDRTWAAVTRLDTSGTARFTTNLFRSANLTDDGTNGAPGTSRFAYLSATDELLAYFGHTKMIQGVRHQGGYLATVNASGAQKVINDWFGSHNLDQRLAAGASPFTALLGLGDAYPKGIFYTPLASPRTDVIFTLAGNGSGTVNGQLGGMVEFEDGIVIPFLTNDSISQALTPGDWPNIDDTISSQIVAAADSPNVMAILTAPKARQPGPLVPVQLDPQLSSGAHLDRLKSARYGRGGLTLLAWSEVAGSGRTQTRNYFTMVIDRSGGICQPKTPLDATRSFTAGDDFVLRPDGSLVWANTNNGVITVVTLTPG